MTRAATVVLAGLLLAGAAPRPPLPLPPPLPADPPTDQAAPVPDINLPVPEASTQNQAAFALRIYRMHDYDTGEGYIPGSAYQSPEDRKPLLTPGFIITVPLQ